MWGYAPPLGQQGQGFACVQGAALFKVHHTQTRTHTQPTTHREIKAKVSPKCKEQLFKLQQASARDFRADPAMREYCAADAEKLCAGVKEGGGRKQACLVSFSLQFVASWLAACSLCQTAAVAATRGLLASAWHRSQP